MVVVSALWYTHTNDFPLIVQDEIRRQLAERTKRAKERANGVGSSGKHSSGNRSVSDGKYTHRSGTDSDNADNNDDSDEPISLGNSRPPSSSTSSLMRKKRRKNVFM